MSIANLVDYTITRSCYAGGKEKEITVNDQNTFAHVCNFVRAHYTVRSGILTEGRWQMSGLSENGSEFKLLVKIAVPGAFAPFTLN